MGAQEKKSVKRHRRHNLKERFEIVKTLGQGTYGKVKLAVEKSSRTKVIIKLIHELNIYLLNKLSMTSLYVHRFYQYSKL